MEEAVAGAELVIAGDPVTVSASDPRHRIEEGVLALVTRTFTQLPLLGDLAYSESGVARILDEGPALMSREADALQLAAEEMSSWLVRQRGLGARTTVKQIVTYFEDKPYGWSLAGILCTIARLVASSQVTLSLDGREVKRTEVPGVLRNLKKRESVLVAPQRQFDAAAVHRLRSFAQEFLTEADLPGDPRDLIAAVKARLASEQRELRILQETRCAQYPFRSVLDEPIHLLGETLDHPAEWYLDELPSRVDALLDAKQDVIDPVRHFVVSSQAGIYDGARRLLDDSRDSLAYLPGDLSEKVRSMLDDPCIFRGHRSARLKEASSALRACLDARLDEERRGAEQVVRERMEAVRASAAWAETDDEARTKAENWAADAAKRVATASSVPAIRQAAADFDESGYAEVLAVVEAGRGPRVVQSGPSVAPTPQIVPIRSIPRPRTRLLRTTADIDAYVEELRHLLNEAIKSGKQVSL